MVKFNMGKTFIGLQIAIVLVASFLLPLVFCAADQINMPAKEKVQKVGQLSLKIKLSGKRFKVGEPIEVKYQITNESQETIYLCPLLWDDFDFWVSCLDGVLAKPFVKAITVSQEFDETDIVKLPPQSSHTGIKIVDDFAYEMPIQVGRYEIYLTYENWLADWPSLKSSSSFWTGKLKSNTETFEIYK
jgi:hypothetical protein